MRCRRCGWSEPDLSKVASKLLDWPAGVPKPPSPPLELCRFHPAHGCPCKLGIGDGVFWDCRKDGDLPPIRGTFLGVVEMSGPTVLLEPDGSWLLKQKGGPTVVTIKLDPNYVLDEHRSVIGPEIDQVSDEFRVDYGDVIKTCYWPVWGEP